MFQTTNQLWLFSIHPCLMLKIRRSKSATSRPTWECSSAAAKLCSSEAGSALQAAKLPSACRGCVTSIKQTIGILREL